MTVSYPPIVVHEHEQLKAGFTHSHIHTFTDAHKHKLITATCVGKNSKNECWDHWIIKCMYSSVWDSLPHPLVPDCELDLQGQ
jgi:hypothetical protein